jgi:hypothetical protein
VNVGINGAQITDAALEHLAKLPKLSFLRLERNRLTGAGLKYLASHPALETLWLGGTDVDDLAMEPLIQSPKLSLLRLGGTRVTQQGLLTLAANPRVRVPSDKHFSADQIAEFEATQRRLASDGRNRRRPPPGDLQDAQAALLSFFQEMSAWEKDMARERTKATEERCAAIFERLCTNKPRKLGRPSFLTFQHPSEYEQEALVDAEQISKQKILLYTKDAYDCQSRYLIVRTDGGWRVDHRESFRGGWKQSFL